jgi:hypothetical protein
MANSFLGYCHVIKNAGFSAMEELIPNVDDVLEIVPTARP